MNFRLCILLSLLISNCAKAQVGGESVYEFLNVSTSARQIALGGEVLTLIDDVSQPIWNPSVINPELDKKLAVNYTSYLAGINIGSISYAQVISRRFGTLHGSIKYLNYGTLIGADADGNETGNFNASDIAISIGYARHLPLRNFYIGGNIRLINSTIDSYTSNGFSVDMGIIYYTPYQPFSFTIVARNMGTQIQSYNGTSERLPFKIAAGASFLMTKAPIKWYFTIDNLQKWQVAVANPSNQTTDLEGNTTQEKISFFNNAFRHMVVGIEIFPKSAINLRLGYNFRRAKELQLQNVRTFAGISFGLGLKMNRFKFNYAYSKIHSATNVSTLSLQIDLDNGKNY